MARVKRLFILGAESHYGRETVKGIHGYCRLHGEWEYRISGNLPTILREAPTAIRQWRADGIIARLFHPFLKKLVRRAGLPAVNIAAGQAVDIPTVKPDAAAIGRMTARYFLDNGFRHFAFCALTNELYTHIKCEAFTEEVKKAGFGCNAFTDVYAGLEETTWVRNRKRMARWLRSLPKPTALMCIYDERAQEVAAACRRVGLRIPEDVAIVSVYNDEIVCEMSTPPLSSVDADLQQIGYEAARLLDRMLGGAKPPPEPILIPPRRVVTRHSSDTVAIDDPEIAAVMRFIREHFGEPISVRDVLLEVPISRRVMEQRFLRAVGRTPKAEITRLRMARARELLEQTELAIPQVAQRSGFLSHDTFDRAFYRESGQTPLRYRRSARRG